MVVRPWVLPDEITAYSDNPAVKSRADTKLAMDIARAELYVIKYTGNRFDGADYPAIPEPVKMAVILLAESYAASAAMQAEKSGNFKSESFDDYSYTTADTAFVIENLNLSPLLDEFKLKQGTINMKFRKL